MNLPEPAVLAGSQVLGLVALPSSAVTARLATDPAPGAEAAPNQWSFVGKQYLDNTSNDARSLDAFFVNNLNVIYEFKSRGFKKTSLSLLVNNLFNVQYEPNGYTYSYNYEGTITENFVYPQAGINFLGRLSLTL